MVVGWGLVKVQRKFEQGIDGTIGERWFVVMETIKEERLGGVWRRCRWRHRWKEGKNISFTSLSGWLWRLSRESKVESMGRGEVDGEEEGRSGFSCMSRMVRSYTWDYSRVEGGPTGSLFSKAVVQRGTFPWACVLAGWTGEMFGPGGNQGRIWLIMIRHVLGIRFKEPILCVVRNVDWELKRSVFNSRILGLIRSILDRRFRGLIRSVLSGPLKGMNWSVCGSHPGKRKRCVLKTGCEQADGERVKRCVWSSQLFEFVRWSVDLEVWVLERYILVSELGIDSDIRATFLEALWKGWIYDDFQELGLPRTGVSLYERSGASPEVGRLLLERGGRLTEMNGVICWLWFGCKVAVWGVMRSLFLNVLLKRGFYMEPLEMGWSRFGVGLLGVIQLGEVSKMGRFFGFVWKELISRGWLGEGHEVARGRGTDGLLAELRTGSPHGNVRLRIAEGWPMVFKGRWRLYWGSMVKSKEWEEVAGEVENESEMRCMIGMTVDSTRGNFSDGMKRSVSGVQLLQLLRCVLLVIKLKLIRCVYGAVQLRKIRCVSRTEQSRGIRCVFGSKYRLTNSYIRITISTFRTYLGIVLCFQSKCRGKIPLMAEEVEKLMSNLNFSEEEMIEMEPVEGIGQEQ
ncbi:hypothetical protein V6N12_000621 [Hibiscus sabdariffa]|uniref:Uncharacterized protein n=1 Tax=Hibiscus sabdariffa TaxID=183260 RepID=A0ABR2B9Y1_9ROSI